MKEKSRKPARACRKGIFLSASLRLFFCSLVCIAALQTGCKQSRTEKAPPAATAAQDLFPDKARIKYARGFSIQYFGSYKVVRILAHFESREDTLQYVLVQRGTEPPAGYPKAQRVVIPVQKMAGMSSVHVALASFAEADEILVGLGSLKYVTAERVRKNIKAGKVAEVGIGGSMNDELLIALHPDLVMATGSPDARFGRYQTLIGAGVPVLLNSEWLETSPLGRAEWVKLMAALVNKEALVNEKFARVEKAYRTLAGLSRKATDKPSVIVGMPFKGTWFVPDGDSYMAQFLKDAAASYQWFNTSGTGSLPLNFEAVYPVALGADYWLNTGSADTRNDILANDTRYADFKPFRQGALYNNNRRVNESGANDYWESGTVNPHLILADLIRILHPQLLPGHELVYYKQIR